MDEDRWYDLAEWRGETVAAMRAIYNELETIKNEQRQIRDDLSKYSEKVSDVRVKVASISAGVSILISLAILIVGSVVL